MTIVSSALGCALLCTCVVLCLAGCQRTATEHGTAPASSAHAHPSASAAPVASKEVTLRSGDASAVVDLRSLPAETRDGQVVVSLAVLWAAGKLGERTQLAFELEGDDGFQPKIKPACAKPIRGADLDKGYIAVATRTVGWDGSLALPRCYGVRATRVLSAVAMEAGGP